MSTKAPVFALVAGEDSGDQLGAALVEALAERYPEARFVGVAGPRMRAAGTEAWWNAGELAVMGLFEVARHFPRLLRLRRELKRRLLAERPDVFIGIDAPDFNLGLEIGLRRAGIRTAHYVSPTVWAWRQRRVRKIARAADRVLCLFPFEPRFYEGHGVAARYVGHPMADRIAEDSDPAAARTHLGLDPQATTVALLPGSRMSEVGRLAGPMLEAAALLRSRRPALQFVSAMANEEVSVAFRAAVGERGFEDIHVVDGSAREAMAAADVVICASGTATLETMLVNRPLVMTYRIAPSTYLAAKHLRLIRPQLFALPNILAGEALVPELIQHEATGPALAGAVERWLDSPADVATLRERFSALHRELRCDGGRLAAEAVCELLGDA